MSKINGFGKMFLAASLCLFFLCLGFLLISKYNHFAVSLPDIQLEYVAENLTAEQEEVRAEILADRDVISFTNECDNMTWYFYTTAKHPKITRWEKTWTLVKALERGPAWIYEEDLLSKEDEEKILAYTLVNLTSPSGKNKKIPYYQYKAIRKEINWISTEGFFVIIMFIFVCGALLAYTVKNTNMVISLFLLNFSFGLLVYNGGIPLLILFTSLQFIGLVLGVILKLLVKK